MVEGEFSSLYKSRLLPTDQRNTLYKTEKSASKVLIASDGDLLVNDIEEATGNPLPLGLDKFTGKPWGNLDFVLNTIDYMLDENGVITARNKEIKLRPLDAQKITQEKVYWQLIVLITPLFIVGLFAAKAISIPLAPPTRSNSLTKPLLGFNVAESKIVPLVYTLLTISESVFSLAVYTEKGEIRIPVILLLKDKAIFVKAPLLATVPASESITA